MLAHFSNMSIPFDNSLLWRFNVHTITSSSMIMHFIYVLVYTPPPPPKYPNSPWLMACCLKGVKSMLDKHDSTSPSTGNVYTLSNVLLSFQCIWPTTIKHLIQMEAFHTTSIQHIYSIANDLFNSDRQQMECSSIAPLFIFRHSHYAVFDPCVNA